MRTGGRRPTRLARLAGLGLAIAAFIVLLGASAPATLETSQIRDFAESGGGASAGGGAGGGLLAGLGPLLLIGLVLAVIVLVAATVILVRTRGAVASPASADGWWTCPKCGAGNMDAAPRCHACSTWRTTTPRINPSTTP